MISQKMRRNILQNEKKCLFPSSFRIHACLAEKNLHNACSNKHSLPFVL